MDNKNSTGDLHSNQLHVEHSGNSDVDVDVGVKIHVDVTPIAFAMLYSLVAQKLLTQSEFDVVLEQLEQYSKKNNK